jgi:glycine/D-amino acid oxidase-like deaminating enzyme
VKHVVVIGGGLIGLSASDQCARRGYRVTPRAAENLIIATGHAMMGLSLSPITGELAAQIADGERPRFDLTLLSPDRYA